MENFSQYLNNSNKIISLSIDHQFNDESKSSIKADEFVEDLSESGKYYNKFIKDFDIFELKGKKILKKIKTDDMFEAKKMSSLNINKNKNQESYKKLYEYTNIKAKLISKDNKIHIPSEKLRNMSSYIYDLFNDIYEENCFETDNEGYLLININVEYNVLKFMEMFCEIMYDKWKNYYFSDEYVEGSYANLVETTYKKYVNEVKKELSDKTEEKKENLEKTFDLKYLEKLINRFYSILKDIKSQNFLDFYDNLKKECVSILEVSELDEKYLDEEKKVHDEIDAEKNKKIMYYITNQELTPVKIEEIIRYCNLTDMEYNKILEIRNYTEEKYIEVRDNPKNSKEEMISIMSWRIRTPKNFAEVKHYKDIGEENFKKLLEGKLSQNEIKEKCIEYIEYIYIYEMYRIKLDAEEMLLYKISLLDNLFHYIETPFENSKTVYDFIDDDLKKLLKNLEYETTIEACGVSVIYNYDYESAKLIFRSGLYMGVMGLSQLMALKAQEIIREKKKNIIILKNFFEIENFDYHYYDYLILRNRYKKRLPDEIFQGEINNESYKKEYDLYNNMKEKIMMVEKLLLNLTEKYNIDSEKYLYEKKIILDSHITEDVKKWVSSMSVLTRDETKQKLLNGIWVEPTYNNNRHRYNYYETDSESESDSDSDSDSDNDLEENMDIENKNTLSKISINENNINNYIEEDSIISEENSDNSEELFINNEENSDNSEELFINNEENSGSDNENQIQKIMRL